MEDHSELYKDEYWNTPLLLIITFFYTIAGTIGGGLMVLPVELSTTGFWAFPLFSLVPVLAEILSVIIFIQVLQKVRRHLVKGEEGPSESKKDDHNYHSIGSDDDMDNKYSSKEEEGEINLNPVTFSANRHDENVSYGINIEIKDTSETVHTERLIGASDDSKDSMLEEFITKKKQKTSKYETDDSEKKSGSMLSKTFLSSGIDLHTIGRAYFKWWYCIIVDIFIFLETMPLTYVNGIAQTIAALIVTNEAQIMTLTQGLSPVITIFGFVFIYVLGSAIEWLSAVLSFLQASLILLVVLMGMSIFSSFSSTFNVVYFSRMYFSETMMIAGSVMLIPEVFSKLRPSQRNVILFTCSIILGIIVSQLICWIWAFAVWSVVPQDGSTGSNVNLLHSLKKGELANVPFLLMLQLDHPKMAWLGVFVEVFTALSFIVSFLVYTSIMKSLVDGYIKEIVLWFIGRFLQNNIRSRYDDDVVNSTDLESIEDEQKNNQQIKGGLSFHNDQVIDESYGEVDGKEQELEDLDPETEKMNRHFLHELSDEQNDNDDDDMPKKSPKYTSGWLSCLVRTTLIYEFLILLCVYVCDGIVNSMFTPILHELSELLHCEEEQVAWIVTSRNLGRLVSTGFAIVLFSFITKICFVSISPTVRFVQLFTFGLFVSVLFVPLVNVLWFIVFDYFWIGFFFEMIEIGINVEICRAFSSKNVHVILQVIHGAYALGLCLFPLLTTQILSIGDSEVEVDVLYFLCSGLIGIGVITMTCICYYPSFFRRFESNEDDDDLQQQQQQLITEESQQDQRQQEEEVTWGKYVKYVWVFILASGIKGVSCGIYDSYAPWVGVYAETIKTGEEEVTYLVFTFWLCVAIGRLSSALVMYLFPKVFILTTFNITILIVIFAFEWAFCDTMWVVWFLTILTGLFVGPLSPYALGICQSYFGVPINFVSVSIAYFGSNVGAIIVSVIINLIWEDYMKSLFPVCLGVGFFGLFVIAVMYTTKKVFFLDENETDPRTRRIKIFTFIVQIVVFSIIALLIAFLSYALYTAQYFLSEFLGLVLVLLYLSYVVGLGVVDVCQNPLQRRKGWWSIPRWIFISLCVVLAAYFVLFSVWYFIYNIIRFTYKQKNSQVPL